MVVVKKWMEWWVVSSEEMDGVVSGEKKSGEEG